jgi:hypothetical protein
LLAALAMAVLAGCQTAPPQRPVLSDLVVIAEARNAGGHRVTVSLRSPDNPPALTYPCWYATEYDNRDTRLGTVSACGDNSTLTLSPIFGVIMGRSPCVDAATAEVHDGGEAGPAESVSIRYGYFLLAGDRSKKLYVTCIGPDGSRSEPMSATVTGL